MGKYLDKSGLSSFWQKIKDTFAKKSDLNNYLPKTGGEMSGNILFDNAQGIENIVLMSYIGFNDEGSPCLINENGRYICIGNDVLDGDYTNYYFPENGGTLALTSDFKTINGQSIIGSGDITISGATGNYVELTGAQTITGVKTFSTYVKSPYYVATGCYDAEDYIETSQLCADGIYIAVPDGEGSTSDEFILFPAKSGTMALTSDVPYTHNIYIMPGTGATSGAYIILTLNVKGRSTAYTTVAQIASYLYSKGHTTQQNCVMASGKCSTSSSTFAGFVVGVYASSSTTLNVVYVTTGGTITSVSYATSLLTSMRDKVN